MEAVGGFACIGHCEIDTKVNTAYVDEKYHITEEYHGRIDKDAENQSL